MPRAVQHRRQGRVVQRRAGADQGHRRSQQAQDCYASHLVEYLYGRDVDMNTDADRNLVTQAGLRAKANPSAKALIVNLVATDAFLSRAP